MNINEKVAVRNGSLVRATNIKKAPIFKEQRDLFFLYKIVCRILKILNLWEHKVETLIPSQGRKVCSLPRDRQIIAKGYRL